MNRKKIIFGHLIFWLLLLLSGLALVYPENRFFPGQPHTFKLLISYLVIESVYLTVSLLCFYGSYVFVAPRLFIYKKYMKALIFTLVLLLAAAALRYVIEYRFFLPVFGFDNYNGHPWPVYDFVSNVFFYYFPRYFVYGLMYFFAENWYRTNYLRQLAEKERESAELAFLKSQINPHFLFNTINDIYALTLQKSSLAPGALLKLSELLRYMLRDSNEDFVCLENEVDYMINLIELQRIGAKGDAFVKFETKGKFAEQRVAPLIFISFLENAFKHGVLNDPDNPVGVLISVNSNNVVFAISNKISNRQSDKTGGIGLGNVKRRLELIYPGRHSLTIQNDNELYAVNLELPL